MWHSSFIGRFFFCQQCVDRTLKTLTSCINTRWVYVLAAHWPVCSFEFASLEFFFKEKLLINCDEYFRGVSCFYPAAWPRLERPETVNERCAICYTVKYKSGIRPARLTSNWGLQGGKRGGGAGGVLNVEILNVRKSFEHSTWLKRFSKNFQTQRENTTKNEKKCQDAIFEKPPRKAFA